MAYGDRADKSKPSGHRSRCLERCPVDAVPERDGGTLRVAGAEDR